MRAEGTSEDSLRRPFMSERELRKLNNSFKEDEYNALQRVLSDDDHFLSNIPEQNSIKSIS